VPTSPYRGRIRRTRAATKIEPRSKLGPTFKDDLFGRLPSPHNTLRDINYWLYRLAGEEGLPFSCYFSLLVGMREEIGLATSRAVPTKFSRTPPLANVSAPAYVKFDFRQWRVPAPPAPRHPTPRATSPCAGRPFVGAQFRFCERRGLRLSFFDRERPDHAIFLIRDPPVTSGFKVEVNRIVPRGSDRVGRIHRAQQDVVDYRQ